MNEIPWGNDQNIKDTEFYNRTQEIDEIKSLLNTTQNGHGPEILLSRIRGVGKTALLKKNKKRNRKKTT